MVRIKRVSGDEWKREIEEIIARLPTLQTKFNIDITRHASERAQERGVDTGEISIVLIRPTETIYDEVRDNYKSYALVRGKYIVVVHTKLNSDVKVITVISTNKKGVSKNGFRI